MEPEPKYFNSQGSVIQHLKFSPISLALSTFCTQWSYLWRSGNLVVRKGRNQLINYCHFCFEAHRSLLSVEKRNFEYDGPYNSSPLFRKPENAKSFTWGEKGVLRGGHLFIISRPFAAISQILLLRRSMNIKR